MRATVLSERAIGREDLKLIGVRLENIGGFTTTDLNLVGDKLLVGENNSGKTSVLRTLDWILNGIDRPLLIGQRALARAESDLLLPARQTRNKARRISLKVEIDDRRSFRRYGVLDGIAEVRIQFRPRAQYAKLGPPARGEDTQSDSKALELIERLQHSYSCLYIPAARDGRSKLFEELFSAALLQHLRDGLATSRPGRQSTPVRKTANAAQDLSHYASDLSQELFDQASATILGGFNPTGVVNTSVSPVDLASLAANSAEPRFSMGIHDAQTVPFGHLGAGLQSMLTIAIARHSQSRAANNLLLLEEPEAFLHPSAQRTIAHQALHSNGTQTIATTHSAAVLAEAQPSSLVLLRSHNCFPAQSVDDVQESKDRYLLSSVASQAMFDRSVLLVEGPGEVAFFEGIRRRLLAEKLLPTELLNRARVCATGSKDAFGPWLRLLRRFQHQHSAEYAISFLACVDSIDAVKSIRRAFTDSGLVVPQALRNALTSIQTLSAATGTEHFDIEQFALQTMNANTMAQAESVPLHLMPVDLEYGILQRVSDRRAGVLAKSLGQSATQTSILLSQLGSKGGSNKPSAKTGTKAPFIRAELSQLIRWAELSNDMRSLLWRWLSSACAPGDLPPRPDVLALN